MDPVGRGVAQARMRNRAFRHDGCIPDVDIDVADAEMIAEDAAGGCGRAGIETAGRASLAGPGVTPCPGVSGIPPGAFAHPGSSIGGAATHGSRGRLGNDEDDTPDDHVGRRDDIDSRSLGTARSRDGGADRRTGDGVRERPGPYRGRGSAPGPGVRHEGRPVRLCRLCRGRPALRRRGGRGRGFAGTVRDAGHRRRTHPPRPGRPLGRPVGAGGGPRRERTARRDRQDAVQAEGGDAGLVAEICERITRRPP